MMIRQANTKTGSSFFLILMMTLATVFSFSIKEASAAQKAVGVNFKKLNITVKKIDKYNGHRTNEVTVEYAIRRGDWNQLDRYRITPKLTLATTRHNTRVKSFLLKNRKGRIQFYTRSKIADVLKVRVAGKSRRAFIDDNGFKSQCARWVKIPVRRYKRPHHGGNGELHAVMQACRAKNISKVRCSKLMRKVGQKRAPAIFQACSDNTKWGSDFKSCVRAASTVNRGAAKAVYACAGPSEGWNSNLVSCLETVATINYRPGALIRACDNATKWFSDFKSCVQVAAPVADSSQVVQACDRATKWGSDLRGCIKSTRGLQDPVAVVQQCDRATDWPSDLKKCVKNGGPYVRHHRRKHRKVSHSRKTKTHYTRR